LKQGFADWLATNRIKAESITEISKSFNYYFIFCSLSGSEDQQRPISRLNGALSELNEKAGGNGKSLAQVWVMVTGTG
jgi:hypothetical protein